MGDAVGFVGPTVVNRPSGRRWQTPRRCHDTALCSWALQHRQRHFLFAAKGRTRCASARQRTALVGCSASGGSAPAAADLKVQLTPSDLGYMLKSCKRCYWLKNRHKIVLRTAFPEVFSKIDAAMKKEYHNQPIQEVAGVPSHWPSGVIDCSDAVELVASTEIEVPSRSRASVTISGKLDALVRFDNGDLGVIDFKTSGHDVEKMRDMYAAQLHSYAMALENSAVAGRDDLVLDGRPRRVSHIGLVVFRPSSFRSPSATDVAADLGGSVDFVEIPRDDAAFFEVVAEAVDVVQSEAAPEPGRWCGACRFVEARRLINL
ncbi:hypothetical protein CDCA_CDCA12G3383 [Cyanidium caldarium]|uniref:PD-(D/E)XK endonuclease-like domain-containing protein n=1 Tax=Cyanidium caldarium TaxID=2771 RepID=A0AAV9IYH0_CYACA|nr:hypothetical protein CDCA_CDCA12G3383 [Cyanidium caldarium]